MSVIAGLVLYVVFLVFSDYKETLVAVARLEGGHWLLIIGLSLGNYTLRFGRWHYYLRVLGYKVPNRCHILYYLAGFALTTTPGKAGETVRSLYLKKHNVDYAHSLGAFFAERLMDLLAMVGLALLVIYPLEKYRWTIFLAAGLVVFILVLVQSGMLVKWLLLWTEKARLVVKLKTALERLTALLKSASILLRSQRLYGGLSLGVLAWGAEGLSLFYILKILGVALTPTVCIGIYAISVLVGALSFMPGGLGSTEAVMGLMLIVLGVPKQEAVAATLICRVATLWFAVGVGFLAMAWLHLRWGITTALPTKNNL